ncbi:MULTISPECIES: hypothetical protein [Acinetobacter calcoaceticus/baumannii complex]|uniref:hypothetical protein n=1 Tax=Acinetobacter calcoaceticus/baumannii complex TaxID=909768 RepID=UPI0004490ED3|nr:MULTISPECIES: hypothetical protein [Acinetobacter calcoaceticus/baumannii complex]EXA83710.1 hypothetical protein J508_4131 [Acinetobacter sp. 1289694]EXA86080.1 hypothetical protein J508_3304 [Acinetobacter sp. 1289694]EXA88715.1 hypothetical protein J508_2310 [Acinetobacter sp. 1289694]KQD42492.1 hypothetical protein APD15_04320 [Acinetobacter baumannii]
MKKFKIICTLIFSFLFFLSCSIFFKHQFNIDGDYLSAFSTIVAATAAFYFYTDWKDEHKFNLLKQHQDYLKIKGAKLLEHFRKSQVLFATIEGSTVQEGEKKWIDACVEIRLFSSELTNIQKSLLEYKSCLSTFDSNEILEKHRDRLEKYSTRISQINDEFVSKLPFYTISTSPQCSDVLESWRDSIIKFDFFCSVEMSDFYFKYLKTK